MKKLIQDVQISNILCFGGEGIHRLELNRINFIIGPNNSGKSALLKILRLMTSLLDENLPNRRFVGKTRASGSTEVYMQIKPTDLYHGTKEAQCIFHFHTHDSFKLTIDFQLNEAENWVIKEAKLVDNSSNDDVPHQDKPKVFRSLAQKIVYIPSNRTIGKFLHVEEAREYQEKFQEFGEERYDGSQILANLLSWFNSPPTQKTIYQRYISETQDYCAKILGFPYFRIRPGSQERTVYLSFTPEGGQEVAIENVGYGIQQVLIIVSALVLHRDRLLLLEEPEIGLHPIVQRRLLELLLCESRQLICTTHSNHIFDVNLINRAHSDITYFRTFFGGGAETATVKPLEDDSLQYLQLLTELGVKPNSIYEANCLFWVEGPSDKLYIKFWLQKYCEQNGLVFPEEGLMYTFLYYGGALIANYGFVDNTEKEERNSEISVFINALRIHPHFYIYADSDRKDNNPSYSHQRIITLLKNLSMANLADRIWISDGKEIESYLPEKFYKSQAQRGGKHLQERECLMKSEYNQSFYKILNLFREERHWYQTSPGKVKFAQEYIRQYRDIPFDELFNQWFRSEIIVKLGDLYRFIDQHNK